MNDNSETPDENERREDLIKAAIESEALRIKKHKRRNSENNTEEAIRKRNDFDIHSGE